MPIDERIKQARLMAGLSLRELAGRAGVSATAISKYETGKDVPSSGVLLRLARALGVKVEYFLRPISVGALEPSYRRHPRLSRKQEKSAQASILHWLERYLEIESLRSGGSTAAGLPRSAAFTVRRLPEVEDAADALRQEWRLGSDPVENLVEVLEDKGIKVGIVDAPERFDACTFWAGVGERVPVIATRKGVPGDRQRFSLAHELGHLLLGFRNGIDEEGAANRFAGAFLVPASVARFELGPRRHNLDLYELHLLKHKYGMSMQAWMHRARDLGIIDDAREKAMFRRFKAHGWRKTEPGDQCPPESPSRFRRLVVQALADGVISESKASELLGKSLKQFYAEVAKQHGELPVGAGN